VFGQRCVSRDYIDGVLDDVLPHGDGVVALVKVYLDRGYKAEAHGITSVAAALFKPSRYKQFGRRWERFLKRWGADAFHATDFYNGAGEYFGFRGSDGQIDSGLKAKHDADARAIPGIISAHSRQLIVVSFKEQEFSQVAPKNWQDIFGSLNSVAAQMIAGTIGHWANRSGYHGEIAYVIEYGDDGLEMEHGLRKLYDAPAQRAHTRMSGYPVVASKGRARGLEVSDFIAWHWNKFYVEQMAAVGPKRRGVRRDFAAFTQMPETHLDVHLVTGQVLEKFLIENGCTKGEPFRGDVSGASSLEP
jgi:hypothetical protein